VLFANFKGMVNL